MDAPVVVALVTAVSSLTVAVVTAVLARRREADLKQLDSRLRLAERQEEREAQAEQLLDRYRGPLLAAAFDLADRLDNILNPERDFLAVYGRRRNPRRDDAVKSTLYRVGQYFCWDEIVRRDRLFLSFREPEHTKAVAEMLADVNRTFADDRYGQDFMLWREEQRAIGERMIDGEGEAATCVGYATFIERYPRDYARWFERFEACLTRDAAMSSLRLLRLRETLRALVATLDPEQLRYVRTWEQPPGTEADASA
jgi:hypothetical protein